MTKLAKQVVARLTIIINRNMVDYLTAFVGPVGVLDSNDRWIARCLRDRIYCDLAQISFERDDVAAVVMTAFSRSHQICQISA